MRSIYDIQQFLKSYGIIIYTGSRIGDLELMRDEICEMKKSLLIDKSTYEVAIYLLDSEISKEKEKKGE